MSFYFKALIEPSSTFIFLVFFFYSSPNCNQSILGSENDIWWWCNIFLNFRFPYLLLLVLLFSSLFLSFLPFYWKFHVTKAWVGALMFYFIFSKTWFFSLNFLKISPNFLKHKNEIITLKWKYNVKMKSNPDPNSVLYTSVVWFGCCVRFIWLLLFLWVFALCLVGEKINRFFFSL